MLQRNTFVVLYYFVSKMVKSVARTVPVWQVGEVCTHVASVLFT